ncbi:MAG: cobaltochelatase subunit CobN [Myxococcales bacterium]
MAPSAERFSQQGLACVSVLARWGHATARALEELPQRLAPGRLTGLVVLQDFVLGSAEARERASRALARLDVPVYKALRLVDRSEAQWRLSTDGLPWDTVHYRLAMPELQGVGQPVVLEAAERVRTDAATGLAFRPALPLEREIEHLAHKLARSEQLARKPNAAKRVAIIYYNHPPGRHNIGADNLDVPASLWELLRALRRAGYDVDDLPTSASALLERLQRDGVNLPEDRGALSDMAPRIAHVPEATYAHYFQSLPASARLSVEQGPLARLAHDVALAQRAAEPASARERVSFCLKDIRHVLEGSDHPARPRALALLAQLTDQYDAWLDGMETGVDTRGSEREVQALTQSLIATRIEGLTGWGPAPGRGMVLDGKLLVPGITFGNVFIGPQPPRGWELDEELLHANLSFAPPHQYLAYYRWLREEFRADVLIHVGRHSTYEWLPGPSVGLSREDFSSLVTEDLPSLYLYIVDGVGEGLAAKRRGGAVIIDHLTPPLSTTPLYDDLLALRQLVESHEAMGSSPDTQAARARAVLAIKEKIQKLHMEDALRANMDSELKLRGVSFNEVSDELLVHEVGHYLTELQERFMPHGLHVFGRPWQRPALQKMLGSIEGTSEAAPARSASAAALTRSPGLELKALLGALAGHFVEPGHGNDPVRRPEVLPTGRNFHALDGGLLPSQVAYALGSELATSARAQKPGSAEGSESVVLWASDTARDEGVMVAFGLDMLGVRPVWNSRGILRSLERLPLAEGRTRRDVNFITSGLFRDLYENLIVWLDRAVLLALDGASLTLRAEHPELAPALDAALAPLGELRAPGTESLRENQLAAHWAEQARALSLKGMPLAAAGREASVRLFGNAPGGYGAGVNNLVERSGSWQDRAQIGKSFALRMGHGYGAGLRGAPMQAGFEQALTRTEHTYLGRASRLYGLLDNNDSFDYVGGLRLAVEQRRGKPPESSVVQYADAQHARVEPLERALFSELRGRHLNPTYLRALIRHGYAGARTLSFGFVENLWGWQVTSPDLVKPWVWDEVHSVYLKDSQKLGLAELWKSAPNAHVKANIEAVLLVAAHKGFWSPDEAVLRELAQDFARLVSENGLPGSGHTRPDHPVMGFVRERLDAQARAMFDQVLQRAQQPSSRGQPGPSAVAELHPDPREHAEVSADTESGRSMSGRAAQALAYGLLTGCVGLFLAGLWRGRT